jgi:CBS domain-containing protein
MHDSLPDLRAEHLMTPDVLTTRPEEPLADAAERLIANRVHRLVVTSEKEPTRPIGILSLTDLAAAGPMVESQ